MRTHASDIFNIDMKPLYLQHIYTFTDTRASWHDNNRGCNNGIITNSDYCTQGENYWNASVEIAGNTAIKGIS